MSFVSWAFVVLFVVVFTARLTIGRRKIEPAYTAVLLVANIVFYAWHVPAYLLILVASSGIDFYAALALSRIPIENRTRRRLILTVSLGANLGLLSFFKYANLLADAVGRLTNWAGVPVELPGVSLILPMGISFYTFQAMSYTIDVYRGLLEPLHSFKKFFLYIIFFPHLVAGPIVRAIDFLPQMPRPRRLRLKVFYHGLWLIIVGFFLKMVCADNLAVYVNEYWEYGYQGRTTSTVAVWLAVMFSGQIFADFAGYTSIARGLAYLLGYRLPLNFNAPYVAASFKNFWERWHISLSTWLRDYLYVPLGGNRGSRVRTYVNLLVVMLLGGLWHGAAYTFIVWGAIHGVALAVERALGLHHDRGMGRYPLVRAGWFVITQVVVLVAWVFFRSDGYVNATVFVRNLFALDFVMPPLWMWVGTLFLLPLVLHHGWAKLEESGRVRPLSHGARAVLAAAMVYCILTLYAGTSEFIYFQF